MARLALPDPPLGDGVITPGGFDPADVAPIAEICRDPEIPRWTLDARSRGVAARPGCARVAEPVVQRTEPARFADDIFFARQRDDIPVGG